MTSNTPLPITPNINTNPDSLPDDSNCPQVNVVTQPSQLIQEEFKLISTPTQQRNHNNLEDDHEDDHEDFELDTDIAFWSWNKWRRCFLPLYRHYV